jgi:hypothetical protein
MLYALQVALSIELISEFEIVFKNRSVKILHRSSHYGMLIFPVREAASMKDFNGSGFYSS